MFKLLQLKITLMKIIKSLLTIIVLTLIYSNFSFADSPITSTPFYEAYLDYDIVEKAHESGVMDEEFANYLHSKENPIDVKAAVINALSWDFNGKKNADIYCSLIFYKTIKEIKNAKLNGDDLFCIGYLLVMDNYFEPERGIPFLNKAAKKLKSSYTVAMINALSEAQKAMDSDWCEVWELIEDVIEDKNLEQDMKEGAVEIILDYMRGYEEFCD